jgi:peptide/nickel transport system substrate-binding protein
MEKGDYSISKGAAITGNDSTIVSQSDFQGDDEWARLLRTKDFRVAMSLAMDRDSVNEIAFLGLAVPMNPIGHPANRFYPGDEYRNLNCCPRDLAAAGALMEKMGYSKNADGMWNRQDGTGILEFHWFVGDWQDKVGDAVAAGWTEFGVNVTTERAYSDQPPEKQHFSAPTDDDKGHNPWWIYWWSWWPVYGGRGVLPCAGQYYYTGGEEGCKPSGPDPKYTDVYGNMAPAGTYAQDISGTLKRYQELHKEGASLSNFDPRRIEIGSEFYKLGAEFQYHYGTVGFGPVSVGIWRNNLRNVPPCCSGRGMGEVAQQYFEDGIDNVNHPGNRSKKYKSFSFALQ